MKKGAPPVLSAAEDPLKIRRENLYDGMSVTVAGRLRLVGSEPFTKYVITPDTNFDIEIDENSVGGRKNIKKFEYRIIKARGILRVKPLRKDNDGKVVVSRYILIVNDLSEYDSGGKN